MGDVVGSSNPQWVINEGDPTIRKMAQNANPTMHMLASILETQTRLLNEISRGGGRLAMLEMWDIVFLLVIKGM